MKLKKDRFRLFCLFSIIFFQVNFAAEKTVDNQISTKTDNIKQQVSTDINYGKIPLYFIPNKGQVSSEARFYAKTHNYTLWMTGKELVFDRLWKVSNEKVITNPESGTREDYKQSTRVEAHRSDINGKMDETSKEHGKFVRDVSRLQFIGANEKTEIIAGEHTGNKVNFFIGNDQSKWSDNIETSKSVVYKDIYNGIDLAIYGTESQIEYDWIVRPGASPASIVFRYENVESTEIDSKGDLVVHTISGDLVHKKPLSYQVIDGKRIDVDVNFKQYADGSYGFDVSQYRADYVLVIDPLIAVYSTCLGGSNADEGFGIAVDSSGAAYIAGHTFSVDFPVVNQYQGDQGALDVFVTKLFPSGNTILYSTYIGGSSNDNCEEIAIDSNGAAYVTGYTNSTDFPLVNQYQGDQPDIDVFVFKLSPSGNSLSYSTYLGGISIERGRDIAVDSSGSAYVTGDTISADFPLVNQYQGNMGDYDAFVTKLSPSGNSLLYSTHLGGSSLEIAWGIAVDSSGSAYVTGVTRSADFPLENEYQGTLNFVDAFVTKFSPSGNTLVFSTYLGGSSYDGGLGIATDSSNAVYITGYTSSADFPLVNEYQGFQGLMDSFVAKFSPSGSTLLYSTCLGGNSQEAPTGGIAVDSSGAAYVVGWTTSSDLPLVGQYQGYNGNIDAFLFKLSPQGDDLLYSTYIGGSWRDDGCGIAVDSSGAVYVTGFTFSPDFPLVNQYQGKSGSEDAFIIKLIWQNPNTAPVAVINADRFGGIAPVMINFDGSYSYDKDGTIVEWRWNFGDGSSSTGEITSHEYAIPGEYTVTLQVRDNDGIWSPIKEEKILILENRESLTCNMTVNPVMFKANGRETGTVSTALSVNGNVIFLDMGLTFSASSGVMMGDRQFDKYSGAYAETLSSGSPGSFSLYTMLDGLSVCQTTVQYTWPLAPNNLQVTIKEDRGLLEGVLYASLTWTDNPSDIYPTAGFNVYKSITGGAWTLVTSLPASARSYTIESLPSRVEIRVGVSKIDTEGDESEMIIQTIQSN
jgi:PKD repeat protein